VQQVDINQNNANIKEILGFEFELFSIDDLTHTLSEGLRDELSNMEKTWHKDLDMYYAESRDLKAPKARPFIGCANHSVSVISSNIDGLVPRLVEDFFNYNEPIELVILDIDDQEEFLASKGNKLMKWDIESHDDLREQVWYFIKGSCTYGTSFMYTYWDEEKDYDWSEFQVIVLHDGHKLPYSEQYVAQCQQQGVPFTVTTEQKKEYKWIKYNPTSICLDNKDVVWNRDADNLEDAFRNGFVGIRIRKTLDDILRVMTLGNNPLYTNLKEIKNSIETFRTISDPRKLQAAWKTKKVDFWLVFTRWDINNDGLEEQIAVLMYLGDGSGKGKILGYEQYKFDHNMCPVVEGHINPIHKNVCGIGIAETLYSDKQYLDQIRNQMADNRTLHNAPIRMFSESTGFNPSIHKPELGANWMMRDGFINNMHIEQVSPIHGDYWQEFNTLKTEINQRIGMSQIEKGQMPDQQTTFRGMVQLLEESAKSRSMFKKWLAESLRKIFYQRFRLYQQYWGREARNDPQIQEWVKQIMLGSTKMKSPITEDTLMVLDHNCNVILKAAQEDQRVRILKERDTFELLQPYLSQPGREMYLYEAYKHLLTVMGTVDIDKRLPNPDIIRKEQMQLQQQIVQQQVQQQQQQQAQDQQRIQGMFEQEKQAKDQQFYEAEKNKHLGRIEESLSGKVNNNEGQSNKSE
jgi:hypothetical protein